MRLLRQQAPTCRLSGGRRGGEAHRHALARLSKLGGEGDASRQAITGRAPRFAFDEHWHIGGEAGYRNADVGGDPPSIASPRRARVA